MIKVWILYLLVAAPAGPEYSSLGAYRDRAACLAHAKAIVQAAIQSPGSRVLGATCAEASA